MSEEQTKELISVIKELIQENKELKAVNADLRVSVVNLVTELRSFVKSK